MTRTKRPAPCNCWIRAHLHDGHCCFADPKHDYDQPVPCGHDDDGRKLRTHAATEPPF